MSATDQVPRGGKVVRLGAHVTDKESSDARMLVVGLPPVTAQAYEYNSDGDTVAQANPEYPDDDRVVEVIFVTGDELNLMDKNKYAYPISRLRVINQFPANDGRLIGGENDE